MQRPRPLTHALLRQELWSEEEASTATEHEEIRRGFDRTDAFTEKGVPRSLKEVQRCRGNARDRCAGGGSTQTDQGALLLESLNLLTVERELEAGDADVALETGSRRGGDSAATAGTQGDGALECAAGTARGPEGDALEGLTGATGTTRGTPGAAAETRDPAGMACGPAAETSRVTGWRGGCAATHAAGSTQPPRAGSSRPEGGPKTEASGAPEADPADAGGEQEEAGNSAGWRARRHATGEWPRRRHPEQKEGREG